MDTVDPLRFVMASMMVLGLLALFAAVLKLHVTGRLRLPTSLLPKSLLRVAPRGAVGGAGLLQKTDGAARLQLVETFFIDYKRKLVIVQRDDVQHLLLLADGRETLIETIPPSGQSLGDK